MSLAVLHEMARGYVSIPFQRGCYETLCFNEMKAVSMQQLQMQTSWYSMRSLHKGSVNYAARLFRPRIYSGAMPGPVLWRQMNASVAAFGDQECFQVSGSELKCPART